MTSIMHIKSKLRKFLGDLLYKTEVKTYRDKLINRNTIKYIVEDQENYQEGPPAGIIRILATDKANAHLIADRVQAAKQDLPINSVRVYGRAIDYAAIAKKEPIYEHSVIINLDPKALLKSAIQAHRKDILVREVLDENSSEKVVIDFSSPNIAKPFHFGHLKSTVLGNYLANLNKYLGNEVIKLNYIGDWGTQYGLLSLGLDELSGSIKQPNTLRSLLDIYVNANERGKTDETFYSEAKKRFSEMDSDEGSAERQKWLEIKKLTMDELRNSYERLGISFDCYDFESDYAKVVSGTIASMKAKGFLKQLDDGVFIAELEKNAKKLDIPVLKSDGASLYITRDVASAIVRKERFAFDKMLYVVGADQEKHFHCLKAIISKLGYDWHQQLTHVKMGKVLGMSSRAGNVVLLADIIDEATKRYIISTRNTSTTKVKEESDIEDVGRNLALSALFVFDMRNPRTKNYEFSWDLVMMDSSRSGINLQTTFARLSSLLAKADAAGIQPVKSVEDLNIDGVCCIEGLNLLSHLDDIDNYLYSSHWAQDASPLVNYALRLCKAINRARRSDRLLVLGEPDEIRARTRLSMFKSSHEQLELIITLLGLKPLHKV